MAATGVLARAALLLGCLHVCHCLDISEPRNYIPIVLTLLGVVVIAIVVIIVLCRSYRKIKARRQTSYDDKEAGKDRQTLMPSIPEVDNEDSMSNSTGGGVEAWRRELKASLPRPIAEEDEASSYAPKKSSKTPSLTGSADEPDATRSQRAPLVPPKSGKGVPATPGNITGKTPRSVKEKNKNKKKKGDVELDELPGGQSPYSTLERGKKAEQGSKKTPIPRPRSAADVRARNADDNRSRKSVTFEDDKVSRKSVMFDDDAYPSDREYGQTDQEKLMSGGYHSDMYGEQAPPRGRRAAPDGRGGSRAPYGSNPMLDDTRDYRDGGGGYSGGGGQKRYGSQGDGLDDRRREYDYGGGSRDHDYGDEGNRPPTYSSRSRGPDNASVYSSRT